MSYGYSGNRGDDRYGDSSSYRSGGSSSYGGGGDRYGGGGDRYGGGGRGGDRYGGGGRGGPSASGAYGSGNSGIGGGLRDIQWDLSKLPVFEKNFYLEHPDVKKRSESESEQWRRTVQITIVGKGIPKPVYTFEEASMPEYILREVLKQGFKTPSPIQAQGWPMALLGRDMIGISKTGSGKTLAFLLPAMIHINAQEYLRPGDGPIVLVLAPTRELAVQIKQECDKFGASSEIKNTVLYGGVPKSTQVRDLRKGVEIVIATPGRLIDHLEENNTNLKRVTYLVLDEADRMLDMGFEPQIKKIVSQIRPDRQTLMWSATWPKDVQQISREFQKDPYEVHVGDMELSANTDVTQIIEVMDDDYQKYSSLLKHMHQYNDGSRVLVFVETKKGCDQLCDSLRRENFPVRAIHGNKSQQERDQTLHDFKSGRYPILVATDVAARGLDVKDVRAVFNFDMPTNMEDYIHRIGRTGRAGAKGVAVSFFVPAKSGKMARELIDILRKAKQDVPPRLQGLLGGGRGGGSYGSGSW